MSDSATAPASAEGSEQTEVNWQSETRQHLRMLMWDPAQTSPRWKTAILVEDPQTGRAVFYPNAFLLREIAAAFQARADELDGGQDPDQPDDEVSTGADDTEVQARVDAKGAQ